MLKPLGKRVVIQVTETEEKTAGGLVLPSAAKEKQQTGKIIAVSKEVAETGEVAVDDIVVFERYAGAEVKHEGVDYLVVDLEHLVAVIA